MATKPTTPRKPAAAKSTGRQLAEAVMAAKLPEPKPAAAKRAPAKSRAHDNRGRGLSESAAPATPAERARVAELIAEHAKQPVAAKRAAKPKPAPAVEPAADEQPAAATLADLTAVQAQIDERGFAERRDADDPLMIRRNELILSAIEQGAGFAAIARARGVSTSTNRGLIRVLQGGKRL